ncbi:nucleoside-binding protein [Pelagirhabdus alkalitolerans]|uniref:Nucleoside-binding protein n=1 Tax=Pelagirhabdus alkalitolerans TaxID=1612202 RepID=A0A1G6H4A4_9BACI|nr:BMP family protein [Pelagirhabdus alkalitolerans]SDB89177.1 nucleoside-binding protein [Pelagirhabdus alkalitolerans]
MKNKLMLIFAVLLSAILVLSACGTEDEEPAEETDDETTEETTDETEEEAPDFSVAMVTDEGGVDDRSFNQSAWEGIQAFGEEHGLERGEGYDYAQSDDAADYMPNLNGLIQQEYDLIFGIGFELMDSVEQVAESNPDTNFALVDDVIEADNVASVTFAEEQGSFLAGVAAALKTESDEVGFVGGITSPLIKRFEVGFVAGVKSVNPDIDVRVEYAETFSDEQMGRSFANSMYSDGIDVIYHASGAVGNGIFTEARNRIENNPDDPVWVIGVDRDQYDEGQQGDHNVALTSMVKRVDVAVQEVSEMAMSGEFPGGEHLILGLEDDAISIADTNDEAYTDEIHEEVSDWEEQILNGDIVVPETDEELEDFIDSL